MPNKVYIETISSEAPGAAGEQENQQANVRIRVRNSETLDEYQGQALLNPAYMDKVQRWVRKGKFNCIGTNNDLELELRIEIFKFHLSKQPKSDIDLLKQEIA